MVFSMNVVKTSGLLTSGLPISRTIAERRDSMHFHPTLGHNVATLASLNSFAVTTFTQLHRRGGGAAARSTKVSRPPAPKGTLPQPLWNTHLRYGVTQLVSNEHLRKGIFATDLECALTHVCVIVFRGGSGLPAQSAAKSVDQALSVFAPNSSRSRRVRRAALWRSTPPCSSAR